MKAALIKQRLKVEKQVGYHYKEMEDGSAQS